MKFNKGDKVVILSASYGWGNVSPNDIGVIVDITKERICLNVPGKTDAWVCLDVDITIITEEIDSRLTSFLERMKIWLDDKITTTPDSTLRQTLISRRANIIDKDNGLFDTLKLQMDSVTFKEYRLYFTTKRITLRYGYDLVDMGFYEGMVNFNSGAITLTQQDPSRYIDHYDHPHISNHIPCFGSYHPQLKNAIDKFDVCAILLLCLDYLSSCNCSGWYHPIFEWMTDDMKVKYRDICRSCYEQLDSCQCERCGNCDNPIDECSCNYCGECDSYDDCQCLRCPDSYDVLSNNRFPDSGCNGCVQLCKDYRTREWRCTYNNRTYYSTSFDYVNVFSEQNARYFTIDEDGIEHDHINVINERNRQNATTSQRS